MSSVLPAALAGAAVALAGGLPANADLRLHALMAAPAGARRSTLPGTSRAALLALGGVGGLVVLGPALALLLAGAGVVAVRVGRARQRTRERTEERRRAVEACAALAAELRAGRAPAQALGVAASLARGPFRAALEAAAAAAGWGADVPTALLGGSARATSVPEVLRGLAACWQVCATAGSGLAASVERLADGLRARQSQERAVSAALAGPRASAALLAGLPLVGIALAAGLGAHPVHVLLHTSLGAGCLLVGVALDGLGLWWTGRIVARAAGGSG